MNTIAKYFNTLKYLKFSQFYNRFIFKFTNPKVKLEDLKIGRLEDWQQQKNLTTRSRIECGMTKETAMTVKVEFPKVKNVLFENNTFKFLNEEHSINSIEDWNNKNINKLWLYNLHYFDYLRQENITNEQRLFWIERWIDENKIGYGNGWEPYTLSLRIVNWIKFYLAGNKLSEKIIKSLAIQTEYLSKKIEYHLLANHLLANAKALVFAGLFFTTESCKKQKIRGLEDWKNGNDNDRGIEVLRDRGLETDDGNGKILQQAQDNRIRKLAEKWLNKGIEIYNKELPEQILNDGGHFERSAMYHSIILEDLLDLKNISAPLELDNYIQKMLDWLSVITGPDEKISLFNDAAFGIALEPNKLFAYAKQLERDRGIEEWKNGKDRMSEDRRGGRSDTATTRSPITNFRDDTATRLDDRVSGIDLEDTGYARLQNNDWTLICDGASLGPDYQLGHSHADTLTFELWYKNERIICDTGTKQYYDSDIRKYQRGTAAHNTIVIDGKNSSQVWSAHRTAKRAKIIERNFDGKSFSATHNGYKPILHKRKWYFENDEVCIDDFIIGKGTHIVESFFHIHPSYDVDIKDGVVKIFNNENTFNMKVDKDIKIFVTDGTVSFEFGKEEINKIVCFTKTVALPFNLKTKIFTL